MRIKFLPHENKFCPSDEIFDHQIISFFELSWISTRQDVHWCQVDIRTYIYRN
jgi:hypothetical protein